MGSSEYHIPVLLAESIEGLAIQGDGIYVDATLGAAGHSQAIMDKISSGHLFGFDQDADIPIPEFDTEHFTLIPSNFRHLRRFLKFHNVVCVNGVLADLGVSSHQINAPSRGFTTRSAGPLDMRMDQSQEVTAEQILNEYQEDKLADVFYLYGELRFSKSLARDICQQRRRKALKTTEELKLLCGPYLRQKPQQTLARIFQALRIEVNDELGSLKDLIVQATEVLEVGGRLVVISYHSLEDRLVKNYIKTGTFNGIPEKDLYGNFYQPLKAINRRVIQPSEKELADNPRSRSAKLRIAEKIYISSAEEKSQKEEGQQ